ncbi:bifunctional DNA primase/polymerase [Streptomyces sp. NBC_01635]|uniref:bifunctional DNA primase/polymerase n=1 Tax=Streptomyces sp. NBC_01635 TaxID=2975904 RepID=UPI0038635EF4|nr:bifunctional DNA primase/polymerase [Streptomyces sp. NBC_01635]
MTTEKTNAPAATGANEEDQLMTGSSDTVAQQRAADTPLDGALWLVRHGFAVFPTDHPGLDRCAGIGQGHDPVTCTDRGKHPCVPFTRAHTLDEDQVRRTFGERLRNVGVAIGAVDGPDGARLLVVDSDRPGALEDAAGAFGHRYTPTMRVTTAKGHHDYYWSPGSLQLGNGLGALRGKFDGDVRGPRGYVIGPGSVHATGVMYELVDPEQPPVPAPAWLLTALQAPAAPPVPRPAGAPPREGGGALVGLVRSVLNARQGNRNSCLYWAACRAFEHARKAQLDARAVAGALVDAATHAGLTEAEARTTIASAYRSAGGTP